MRGRALNSLKSFQGLLAAPKKVPKKLFWHDWQPESQPIRLERAAF
jgi:hypothetical protein